jgi:hypothetical protein
MKALYEYISGLSSFEQPRLGQGYGPLFYFLGKYSSGAGCGIVSASQEPVPGNLRAD